MMRAVGTLMVCDAVNIHLELTVTCPLPHARNHFVITTGFVATKVAERKVTEAKSDEERRRWSKLTSLSTPQSFEKWTRNFSKSSSLLLKFFEFMEPRTPSGATPQLQPAVSAPSPCVEISTASGKLRVPFPSGEGGTNVVSDG